MTQPYWETLGRAKEYGDRSPSPFVTSFFGNLHPKELTDQKTGIDIGCGGGRHTEFLAGLGIFTIAIDKYVQMLNFTKNRLSSVGLTANFIQAEMDSLPIRSGTVDYAISNGVLHNAESVLQIQRAFCEIARILRPGGFLLLNLFTNQVISSELTPAQQDNTWITVDGIPMVLLSPEEINKLFTQLLLHPIANPREKIVDVETGKRSVYKTIVQK